MEEESSLMENFEKSGGTTVPPDSSLASPVRVTEEDSIYVAVGRDGNKYKSILKWAIDNSGGTMIYILYVHRPAKFPIMSMIKRGHRETDGQRINNILEKYQCICREYKVQSNSVHIEKDSIKRGIVALITQRGIRNLVMGAAADKHYKEDMKAPMCRKAVYVNALAPPSCRIRFICRGNLIDTREAHIVTGHSTVNNGRSIKDIEPSSSSSFPAEGYSSDDSEGSSRTSFLVSSCSSPYKTMLSPSWGNENRSELSALSPASGYSKSPWASPLMQPSLMLPSSDGCLDGTSYGELHEARANIEKGINLSLRAERENFEKALRMAQEEIKQRIKIEEVLVREREELEQVKNQRDQMMEKVRIVKEEKTLIKSQYEELKKTTDELQIKLALKEAEELRRKQAEDSRHMTKFSLSEIEKATQGFKESLIIGIGGYGSVYKGFLCQKEVAIKRLNSNGNQGAAEFGKEVQVLSQLSHPNIVRLIGYCSEAFMLIYEYLPNGSLEDWLKCKNKRRLLPLQARLRISMELCSVLVYLHSREPHSIVHADLKPANILLDANLESRLGDFGMCRILCREMLSNDTTLGHITIPKGTIPYIDPAFISSGKLTRDSDVYSFGILLLRLLTGRPAADIAKDVQDVLDAENLKSPLDPLAGDWPFELVQELVHMALRCCNREPKNRPDLESDVMMVLERTRASCVGSCDAGGGQGTFPA